MKTKKTTKFTLEKFEVAKLKNPKMIFGGINQGVPNPNTVPDPNPDPNTVDNTIGGTDSKTKPVGNGG